jgi:hypothetical protein
MRLYMRNLLVLVRHGHLLVSAIVLIICVCLLTACARPGADAGDGRGSLCDVSTADGNSANGPTILLGYSKDDIKLNSICSFAYFVPLISPTLVDRETSADNEQQIRGISYERKVTSDSFDVTCEFEISGNGFHTNVFDPAGMIESHTGQLKKGESLTEMLDYIRFEGEGFGWIEVKGTMTDSRPTVTEVYLQFNGRGHKSPVTVGIYDVKPRGGQYKYENRSNEMVARVNSLVFKKTDGTPTMAIKIASLARKNKRAGLFAGIKGAIANAFITPPEITKLGNDTMLNFGYAVLNKEPTFTFPRAVNVKEDKRVPMDKDDGDKR